MNPYGIRKVGTSAPFTIMAMVKMNHDGEGPSSEMYLHAWATIVVGDFGLRRALFCTRDFVFAAELMLYGDAVDYREPFALDPGCVKLARQGELEIFDVTTGASVPVEESDERFKEFTSWRGTPALWAKEPA